MTMTLTLNDVEIYDYCPPNTFNKRDELLAHETGKFNRVIIFIRELFIASHGNRSARKYLKSHAEINNEKLYQLRHHIYVLHPFSVFRHWWNIIMVWMIVVGLILIPFQAAFDMSRSAFESYDTVKTTVIVFCCCDIFINFLTGYYDKTEGFVILKFKNIAAHYATKHFVFDLLGSLPTDVIFVNGLEQYVVIRELASLIFLLRSFSLLSYSNKLSRHYEFRRSLYDFFNAVCWFFIIIHWQACLYWIAPVAVVSATSPQRPKHESWINSLSLWEDASNANKYKACLFRSIATLMGSGFLNGTELQTTEDLLTVSLSLCLSILMFSRLLAGAMNLFVAFYSSKLKYGAAMSHLQKYIEYNQLPRRMQDRVEEYYKYIFQARFFKHPEIVSTLSLNTRREHRMHSCRKLVENVIFLNNLPLSLLARLVTLLRSEVYLVNDTIIEANQTGNCMYFIASGTVAVYDAMKKEVSHLKDGAHFGEISIIIPDAKSIASVVAVETCKLYRLERADFAKTIQPYPLLWKKIQKIAIEWHNKKVGALAKR